jgi:hypothetical protein
MPRDLPKDYFSTGVWAADGLLRLRHCTCVVCGTRLATWEAFREHRRACAGTVPVPAPQPEPPPEPEPEQAPVAAEALHETGRLLLAGRARAVVGAAGSHGVVEGPIGEARP